MRVSFWMIWGRLMIPYAGHSYIVQFGEFKELLKWAMLKEIWQIPFGKVTGLIFSQNYRNYPIHGTMETMFIEGFHWNMHGFCLATLLLTMQFHNQCQAYYTSVVLQQHECGTWRKLLIKVAMWPQTQVVQPNFETEDFSNSMRSVTGTGRFVKAMVSSRQGWHRCIRRQCQDLSVNCHILDSNFWKLHFVDYTFKLMASGYATMPLCLQGSWTEELQCVHSLPAMFGHHQVCGTLSMVKVIFFRDCALAFLLSKRLQEA